MKLYGKILQAPLFRFDYSEKSAVAELPKKGLYIYGPYDSNLLGKDEIKCAVIYPIGKNTEKNDFCNGIIIGEGNFKGFKKMFKLNLKFVEEKEFSPERNISIFLKDIIKKDIDIAYVLLEQKNLNLYRIIKQELLGNGIPNQIITIEKLKNNIGRQYILENISLATYAKIGGTPWTILTNYEENKLILGVSRAKDPNKKYFVGFVVLFTNQGDFIFINSSAPVIEWEKYVEGLRDLIMASIEEYSQLQGTPSSIIIHFHKRPGKREIRAIEDALSSLGMYIPYALVHINEYSNFRLFDSSHPTYVPPSGLIVNLSAYESLILLDGRIGDSRNKVGVPRVLNVRIDKRSKMEPEKFPEIFKQVYDFSFINWRGFNAAKIPVTLNYSKLIARMIIEVGASNWNSIIANGKLRDKAWFI